VRGRFEVLLHNRHVLAARSSSLGAAALILLSWKRLFVIFETYI
jgi:hypothetical protein